MWGAAASCEGMQEYGTVISYSCGESNHISAMCTQPKNSPSVGKVFSLSGEELETFNVIFQS
ncbi:hypothetical protein TSUD_03430 [Trifolium subterraneum]|nr:hypothetical protein TSUD_03430 [Trifolium subterraneum]